MINQSDTFLIVTTSNFTRRFNKHTELKSVEHRTNSYQKALFGLKSSWFSNFFEPIHALLGLKISPATLNSLLQAAEAGSAVLTLSDSWTSVLLLCLQGTSGTHPAAGLFQEDRSSSRRKEKNIQFGHRHPPLEGSRTVTKGDGAFAKGQLTNKYYI